MGRKGARWQSRGGTEKGGQLAGWRYHGRAWRQNRGQGTGCSGGSGGEQAARQNHTEASGLFVGGQMWERRGAGGGEGGHRPTSGTRGSVGYRAGRGNTQRQARPGGDDLYRQHWAAGNGFQYTVGCVGRATASAGAGGD